MSDLNLPYADSPEDDASKNTGEDFNSGIIRKTEYFDLFISYKRDNGGDHGQKLAEELYEKLTADGYKIWLDNQEIGYSSNFEQRIEEAIIHSKKFVAILGPAWVESPNCRYEFQKAVGFEKRIIPIYYQDFRSLLTQKKDKGALTEHEWTRIDKPQEVHFGDKENFNKAYKALKALCDLKDEITTQHTRILCESYYWEKYNKPKSMLLFGSLLSRISLLKAKCNSDDELPSFTPTQSDFVDASQKFVSTEVSNKRKVFISFQPSEYAFASELNTELRLNNITTWFDEGLEKSESDSSFIEPILNCENVLDVTSIDSSSNDDLRVAFARSNSKRILRVTDSMEILAELREKGEKNSYFWNENVSIDKLITTINGDQVYNSAHANLLGLAFLWEKAEKNTNKLLLFKEAEAMKTWYQAAEKAGIVPQPNLAMINFVERSLTHAETVRKRRRLLIWSVVVGIVILIALGFTTLYLKSSADFAEKQTREANNKKAEAERFSEKSRIEAARADSLAVVAIEKAKIAKAEAVSAGLLAKIAKADANSAIANAQSAKREATEEKRLAAISKAQAENSAELAKLADSNAAKANKKAEDAKKELAITTLKTNAAKLSFEAFELTLDGKYDAAEERADAAVLLYNEIEGGNFETDVLYNTYYSVLTKKVETDLNSSESRFTNETSFTPDSIVLDDCYYITEEDFSWDILKKIGLKGEDTALIYSLVYSKDFKLGALGAKNGKIYLFNSADNTIFDTISVGTYRVTSMGFNEQGSQLVASTVNDMFAIIPLLKSSGKRDPSKQILRRETFARIEEIEYLNEDTIRAIGAIGKVQGEDKKKYMLYPATVKKITEILK
jgi:hypothetical protein